MEKNSFENVRKLKQGDYIATIKRRTQEKRSTWLELLQIANITDDERNKITEAINDFSRLIMQTSAVHDSLDIERDVIRFNSELSSIAPLNRETQLYVLISQIRGDARELLPTKIKL